jgi:hypothetical protein
MTNPFFWCTLAGLGACYAAWEVNSGTAFVLAAFVTGSAATILATGSVRL